jgi:hypothetical protein
VYTPSEDGIIDHLPSPTTTATTTAATVVPAPAASTTRTTTTTASAGAVSNASHIINRLYHSNADNKSTMLHNTNRHSGLLISDKSTDNNSYDMSLSPPYQPVISRRKDLFKRFIA